MSAKSQVCHKCKESRTITQFALDASKKGGRQNTCKPCVNSNRKPKAKTQKTDLKKIIKKDDLKTLKKALEELSFETKRSCGLAAEENAVGIFKEYLPECGNITVALDKAIYYEHKDLEKQKEIVKLIIEKGPNLEATGGCFTDPLYLMMTFHHPDIGEMVIDANVEPSVHFLAATHSTTELKKRLKKDPFQVNAFLSNGLTPIYCAVRSRLGT